MSWLNRPALALFVLAVVVAASPAAAQTANEPDRSRFSDVILHRVFPQATRFGPLEGAPPSIAAYAGERQLGYVFSSRQVVRSTGYSGKPLDVVVGIAMDGTIAEAVIAEHHEPILIIGVADADLQRFVAQYRGRNLRETIHIERWDVEATATVDAVSGATISSLMINDAIIRSARAVAASRGLLGSAQARLDAETFEPANWNDLLADGSIARLEVTVGEAVRSAARGGGRLFAAGVPPPADDKTFVELYAALATPARIGRNILGERRYGRLRAAGAVGRQLIFVAGRGYYSFKGRGYRKSGVFERIQLVQGETTFRLRKDDHERLERVAVADAPSLREAAVFALPPGRGFDPAAPWRLRLLVGAAGAARAPPVATFELPYRLPARYLRQAAEADFVADEAPLWQRSWWARRYDVAILSLALVVLTLVLVFQDSIARRRTLYSRLRLGFLIFTLVWIGWITKAQLSVLNVLAFSDSLMSEFHWEFFLLEPLIFILWSYAAIALLFWGRGVYCGWLCPFGALQELLIKLADLVRLPQWRLPFALHERLWPIKYMLFLGIFAVFLHDPAMATRGAEVEPFKTAIVLAFDRAWPYVLYAVALMVAALFVNRAFCRYLCPLGAALAIPARIRMFEWIKRRWQCGTPCQICAQRCPVQAIHPEGRINPNECIHCLNCQTNYFDANLCPPLLERQARRERAARLRSPGPLSPPK